MRHLLSLTEIGPDNLAKLVKHSLEIVAGRNGKEKPLAGKIVGIYFSGTSTRTRTSFMVGALRLGASTVAYGPHVYRLPRARRFRIRAACFPDRSTRSWSVPTTPSKR